MHKMLEENLKLVVGGYVIVRAFPDPEAVDFSFFEGHVATVYIVDLGMTVPPAQLNDPL